MSARRTFTAMAGMLAFTIVAADAQVRPMRLPPEKIAELRSVGAGAGTSGVIGVESIVLAGDPAKPGLYTIEIRVPAHTRIAAHAHRDDRTAVVVSGRWFLGYGRTASDVAAAALTPGSFYTEPAGAAHFAHTEDEPAAVYITGVGPTDTVYVDAANAPH